MYYGHKWIKSLEVDIWQKSAIIIVCIYGACISKEIARMKVFTVNKHILLES